MGQTGPSAIIYARVLLCYGAPSWDGDELDAEAIVLDSRGLTGMKSLLLGSVSHALLQHADRPVLVVPSPAVTEARAQQRRDRHA